MANHKSSLKRVRQTETRNERNRYQSKTTRNAVRDTSRHSDKKEAEKLLPEVNCMLDKLAKRNIIHKNKAANLKSSIEAPRQRAEVSRSHHLSWTGPPFGDLFFFGTHGQRLGDRIERNRTEHPRSGPRTTARVSAYGTGPKALSDAELVAILIRSRHPEAKCFGPGPNDPEAGRERPAQAWPAWASAI